MSELNTKDFLQQIELFDNHINNKLEELERLRSLTLKITSSLKDDVVSASGSQDKLGDAVAKIIDLQDEINQSIDLYVDRKREVNRVLEQITDVDYLQVLSKRYLLYESWEQIAMEMGYTYRHITRLHGEALQAVRKILNEKDVLKCP